MKRAIKRAQQICQTANRSTRWVGQNDGAWQPWFNEFLDTLTIFWRWSKNVSCSCLPRCGATCLVARPKFTPLRHLATSIITDYNGLITVRLWAAVWCGRKLQVLGSNAVLAGCIMPQVQTAFHLNEWIKWIPASAIDRQEQFTCTSLFPVLMWTVLLGIYNVWYHPLPTNIHSNYDKSTNLQTKKRVLA